MRWPILLLSCFLSAASQAAPDSPVTVTRPDDSLGDPQIPGLRPLSFAGAPYVEEEFFIEGNATVYTYEQVPRPTVVVPLQADVPYKTRILVRRPVSPKAFHGTVVLEWWNSTGGFDLATVWDASADFFGREGWIYVGVTNADTGFLGPGTGPFDFLRNGCVLLGQQRFNCGRRYATLSLVEEGQAFEMVSQIVHLLKGSGPDNPIPANYRVKRIFHTGQSQQGGSVITYATAFHDPLNDGYFVQTASTGRPINFGTVCGPRAPAYPDCTPRLLGRDRLVRTDLDVPVYRLMTETDMRGVLASDARQSDTDHFRYYETAGTAHAGVHKNVEVFPGLSLEQTCANPLNTHADGPVFGSYLMNAMWRNMEREVKRGTAAPHGELLEVENQAIARDAYANARGGIRLPELDVPIASYAPSNVVTPGLPALLGLFCALTGSVTPFDPAVLDELYPNHGRYVNQYNRAVNELVRTRFLLPPDAKKLRTRAAQGTP